MLSRCDKVVSISRLNAHETTRNLETAFRVTIGMAAAGEATVCEPTSADFVSENRASAERALAHLGGRCALDPSWRPRLAPLPRYAGAGASHARGGGLPQSARGLQRHVSTRFRV